jgi:hypothetical protein
MRVRRAVGAEASAHPNFTAQLAGDQVAPTPSGSAGLASGSFILNDAMTMLSFDITFSGLTSSATALHFHDAPPGTPGPLERAFTLPAVTSGEFMGVWSSTDAMPLTPALVAELEAGNIYVDLHTTNFPRDPQAELRGQVTQETAAVPEPSSLTLITLGTLGLLGYDWRRRKWAPREGRPSHSVEEFLTKAEQRTSAPRVDR